MKIMYDGSSSQLKAHHTKSPFSASDNLNLEQVSNVTFKSQIGDVYFNLKFSPTLWCLCQAYCLALKCTNSRQDQWAFWVKCILCMARGGHFFSYISVIRHLGAVWAWPDLHSCTGTTLNVEWGVGTWVTLGMAVGVEIGTAGLGSGVTGATDCGVH